MYLYYTSMHLYKILTCVCLYSIQQAIICFTISTHMVVSVRASVRVCVNLLLFNKTRSEKNSHDNSFLIYSVNINS